MVSWLNCSTHGIRCGCFPCISVISNVHVNILLIVQLVNGLQTQVANLFTSHTSINFYRQSTLYSVAVLAKWHSGRTNSSLTRNHHSNSLKYQKDLKSNKTQMMYLLSMWPSCFRYTLRHFWQAVSRISRFALKNGTRLLPSYHMSYK